MFMAPLISRKSASYTDPQENGVLASIYYVYHVYVTLMSSQPALSKLEAASAWDASDTFHPTHQGQKASARVVMGVL